MARDPSESRTPPADEPLEVLLIDASALNRSCFSAGLTGEGSVRIIAYEDVASVVPGAFSKGMPDLVILRVVGMDGSDEEVEQCLRALAKMFPPTATMLITPTAERDHILTAIRHEIEGLTTDQLSIASTIDAMRLVFGGMLVYPRELFGVVQHKTLSTDLTPKEARLSIDRLTVRQYEVLQLIAGGLPNRAIAQRLRISESTVKVHVKAIMERLGLVNRTQAAARFLDARSEDPGADDTPSARR